MSEKFLTLETASHLGKKEKWAEASTDLKEKMLIKG